jgi:hypothetical protein
MSPDPGAIRAIVEQAEDMRVEPPRPLTRIMPPADAFPVGALGDMLGAAAQAIHDRVQAPLANLQSICSRRRGASGPNSCGCRAANGTCQTGVGFLCYAETGARKSASDTEAIWPIRKREQALCETRDAETAKLCQ